MNRTIKFRAWDNKEKRLRFPDYTEINNNKKSIDWIFGNALIDLAGNKFCGDYGGQCENDRFIFQQYTGLKDRNNKEIFEGDIVKGYKPNVQNPNFVGQIVFEEGGFHIKSDYYQPLWYYTVEGMTMKGFWCEVIGNIFENPELLK
jgi:uncharacterized phage protein (TIGR01671 family)